MERIEKYCYTKKDFKIEWFSGTGPGGQNRNKVQTCCRITHIPSRLKSTGQRDRSRQANFRNAFQSLGEKVKGWIIQELNKNSPYRQPSNETIRTYNYADNRVVDHASGCRFFIGQLDKKFDEIIIARRNAIQEKTVLDSI
jgi:peptide chain release factor 1